MKNYLRRPIVKLFLFLAFFIFISAYSFSQAQNNSGSAAQSAQVKTIILKAYGIKSDDVFLKYKNFLTGLKGVSVSGRTLTNEYLVVEMDASKIQVIEVLQSLKDSGYVFEYLYDNPSPQKLQELFANDPLIK